MIRVFSVLVVSAISAFVLATTQAQGVIATITFLADMQHVTTGADHEVTKLKFTSHNKSYAYVNNVDLPLAAKAKFVYVADGVKKEFTAASVMKDATAKKALQKGKVVSIRIGGTQGNAVVDKTGIQEVRFGPSIEAKAKKE
jgi:hypothetical protein